MVKGQLSSLLTIAFVFLCQRVNDSVSDLITFTQWRSFHEVITDTELRLTVNACAVTDKDASPGTFQISGQGELPVATGPDDPHYKYLS
jgi:hypothetical protein